MHVAAVRVPAVQELVPETVCPELHVGWHVDPLANELMQSPKPPFAGAVDTSQQSVHKSYTRTRPALEPAPLFLGAPIATRVPSEDIDTDRPDQSPSASPSMSAPTWVHVPLLSASATEHVAAVNVPKEHELVPDTVYPVLHVG